METDPGDEKLLLDEFDETIGKAWKDLMEESNTKAIQLFFPAEVIDSLKPFGKPSWELVRKAFRTQAHRSDQLGLEVMRLMQDEDSFDWPLQEPLRCLAIGILRKLAEKFLDESDECEVVATPSVLA
jgi:hypothetical protein